MITRIAIIGLLFIQISYGKISFDDLPLFTNSLDSASSSQHSLNDTAYKSLNTFTDQFEEVYLSFNYFGIVNRTLTVNYNGVFFLPIGEIFDQLLINYNVDRQKDIIKGFYIYSENFYELDFKNLTFKNSDTSFAFSRDYFIKKDFDYYLTPELFYKAFRLSFSVDLNNLSLDLHTPDVLPVYSKYLREQKYNYFSTQNDDEQFPMLFPRRHTYLRGGFIDYTFSGSYSKYYLPFYSYDLGAGAELLGGDLQTSVNGYTPENSPATAEFNYRWRYVFNKNPLLSQISVGNLAGGGINSYTFEGLQISNQPLEQREAFIKYLISEQTSPGSSIELYINNQLVDQTVADAAGNFHFFIPLDYGSTFVKFKYFGLNGETKIVDRYYQIPYSLNPPEEFNYTVNLGKIYNTNNNYFQASGIYGINDWLSDVIGAEYLNDVLFDKMVFYNSLTARISSSYLLNLFTASKSFYTLSANAIYPSLTSVNLSYTKYEPNPLTNPAKIKNEISSNINLPLYIDDNVLSFQMYSIYQELASSKSYDIRFGSSKNLGKFTPTLTYNFRQIKDPASVLKQSYLTAGALYSVGILPAPINFLQGILINSNVVYNFNYKQFESYFISAASNLTSLIRLQFDLEKNLIFNITNARMQVFLELPFTRSYSTMGKDYFTSNLQGSILFNDLRGSFSFFNRDQIGRAVSSFRMFNDTNGNSTYDDGEDLITGAKVNIESLRSNIRISGNETIAHDLNPFSVYKVRVDESSINNPYLAPKYRMFSFEAGANYVNNIDIPFYSGSEISGSVFRITNSSKSTLPGIKIHVEGIDNNQSLAINTFSDGSFYYFGLSPGNFRIYLDKNQLEYINCVSVPAELTLHIDASSGSKSFENLDFEVLQK